MKVGKALMACVDKNGESHTYESGDPNPCEEKKAEAPKKDCAKVKAEAKQCKKNEKAEKDKEKDDRNKALENRFASYVSATKPALEHYKAHATAPIPDDENLDWSKW